MRRAPSTPEQKAAKAAYDRERRARLKDEIAAKKRAYYLANKDKEDARVAAWCAENKDRSAEIKRAWRERNRVEPKPRTREPEEARKKKAIDRVAAWRAANPEKYAAQLARAEYRPRTPAQKARHAAHQSLRSRRVRQAQPQWADPDAIALIYLEAQRKGMHVDHIVPLKGKTVCGLHVESNLQLLQPTENLRKRNKFSQEPQHAD